MIGQPNSLISFEFPSKTIEINFIYLSYVVNACLNLKINPRIFYASSGEIFGNSLTKINENTKKILQTHMHYQSTFQ